MPGHVHVAADAIALSRFTGIAGYRTADGVIHLSRADAQEWLCEQRQARQNSRPTTTEPEEGTA
ncbi:hypothetical protein [Nocardioides bruguierae]|uniref:Uncharacterized protein n=1 Tax=Nocardioides bruguierae TaxID=2945102 RepID=A0A9X2DC66_9ACTN|nr:hypothetical protein [Nocardioides bruguierae]MCM0622697.1 hypothetical protein [Nocardioides bruguierae]